jgi:hypothetical protein
MIEDGIREMEVDTLKYRSLMPIVALPFEKASVNEIQRRLEDANISPKYRQALERKCTQRVLLNPPITYRVYWFAFISILSIIDVLNDPVAFRATSRRTRSFLQRVEANLETNSHFKSLWIFGTKHGTALDGHVAVLVWKLLDGNRRELVPLTVQVWATKIFETDLWKNFIMDSTSIEKETLP